MSEVITTADIAPAVEAINQLNGAIEGINHQIVNTAEGAAAAGKFSEDQLNKIRQRAAEESLQLDTLKIKGEITSRHIMSVVHGAYNLLTNVLNVFGVSIGGVMGALVQAAFSTASVLFQMASAQSMNPWTAVTAALTFISAAMTITAAVQAERAAEQSNREINLAKKTNTTLTIRL